MKRLVILLSLSGFVAGVVFSALLLSGCEEATGLKGLQLDPSSAVLTTNGETVVFTVTGGITNELLALPLTWSVSDGNLGRITHNSGYSAIYERASGNGVNTVTVMDQYENEGYATVKQMAAGYGLNLTASASTLLVNEAATITITTASAQAPFSWQLQSGPGSLTGDSGSWSAAYTSTTNGTAVIAVTDANGASGVIAIVVEEAPTDGDGGGGGAGGA